MYAFPKSITKYVKKVSCEYVKISFINTKHELQADALFIKYNKQMFK